MGTKVSIVGKVMYIDGVLVKVKEVDGIGDSI